MKDVAIVSFDSIVSFIGRWLAIDEQLIISNNSDPRFAGLAAYGTGYLAFNRSLVYLAVRHRVANENKMAPLLSWKLVVIK
jgi:hypothetical protein